MKHVKVSHKTLATTMALLLNGPVTAQKISMYAQVHLVSAQAWMRALRQQKVVRIVGWEPDSMGRDATPVYAIGQGEDAPRRKMSAAERTARYRAKHKQEVQEKNAQGEVL
jgi:predicted ArsR family transcriptional regulator